MGYPLRHKRGQNRLATADSSQPEWCPLSAAERIMWQRAEFKGSVPDSAKFAEGIRAFGAN